MINGKIAGVVVAAAVAGGAVGAIGYAYVAPEKTKEVEVRVLITPSATPTDSATGSESAPSQADAIIAAVRERVGDAELARTPQERGDYARVIVGSPTSSSGTTYYLKKTNGAWQVIYEGDGRSMEELQRLGIPADLYQ